MNINNDNFKETNNKIKNKSKNIIILFSSLFILISLITIFLFFNIRKANILEYGELEFNKEMNLSNINLIESSDETPVQVPVPKGYVASSVESERTVNGGFVIYEGEEEVTDANLEEAKRTRNQFVWIPIENAGDMYYMSGSNMYGAYYNFATTGYTRATGTREPSVVSYDKDGTYLTQYMNGITREKFLREMQQSFYEMVKSVDTYGGFYIGRYETGNLKQNVPVVVKMNTDIHSVNWYDTYKRSKRISGLNENVTTNMVWGIQFDEALKWLIDTGSKTNEEVAKDSKDWGNYRNVTFEYTNTSGGTSTKAVSSYGTRIPTGSAEYTKANNIYDLAGNVWEWTMEAYGGSYRYYRGGSYVNASSSYPAHYRIIYYPNNSNYYIRFEGSTLYQVALKFKRL